MQHIVKGMGVTKCKSNIFETDIFCTLSFNSSINTIAYLIHQKEKKKQRESERQYRAQYVNINTVQTSNKKWKDRA
jgi:hypothetical protein